MRRRMIGHGCRVDARRAFARSGEPADEPWLRDGQFLGLDTGAGTSSVILCLPLVQGCAPGGGQYAPSLSSLAPAFGNVSVLQNVSGLAAGTYEFGATVSFVTNAVGGELRAGPGLAHRSRGRRVGNGRR